MDILDEELINFWKSLNQYEVKYIMIGGFAVNLLIFMAFQEQPETSIFGLKMNLIIKEIC